MLSMFKKAAAAAANRYTGRTDVLEAMAAAAALVAASDGNIADDEVIAALDVIKANKVVGASFAASQIEAGVDKQFGRVKTLSGRIGLKRELEDVAKKDQETREDVLMVAADVAAASGDIGPEEKKALGTVANALGLNLASYL